MAKSKDIPAQCNSLGPLEGIYWRDITSRHIGWSPSPDSGESTLCFTLGIVLKETDKDITVWSSFAGIQTEYLEYSQDTVIPKGCIVKRHILRKRLPKA